MWSDTVQNLYLLVLMVCIHNEREMFKKKRSTYVWLAIFCLRKKGHEKIYVSASLYKNRLRKDKHDTWGRLNTSGGRGETGTQEERDAGQAGPFFWGYFWIDFVLKNTLCSTSPQIKRYAQNTGRWENSVTESKLRQIISIVFQLNAINSGKGGIKKKKEK